MQKIVSNNIFYIAMSTILCTFATDLWKYHS